MSATTTTTGVLNWRALGTQERSDAIVAALDSLEPGGSLLAEFDAPGSDLLRHLQLVRPGQFEWSPLEAAPGLCRIQIDRRGGLQRRAVNEALAWDHDRLDVLEKRAFELRAAGDLAGARKAFAAFSHGLRRHIRFEEEIVFPEFETRSGMPAEAGPTAVMRVEHRQILESLAQLEASIGDPLASPERFRVALIEVLTGHNQKEEQVLYPAVDRLLGEAGADALVARIQAL